MKNKLSVVAVVLALVALVVPLLHSPDKGGEPAAKKETAFERVMRTRTIRCGYAVWDPLLYKDLKTGEMLGIAHDVFEEVGKKLDLKIDWAEEASWGTIVEGLATNRYDAICVTLGSVPSRAKVINFTVPLTYTMAYMIVRQDEKRFDHNMDLNKSGYTIAVLDGDISSLVVPKKYAQAHISSLSQSSEYSLLLQEVETGKADATVVEMAAFDKYQKTNPGKLRVLNPAEPVVIAPLVFGVPQGDVAFKAMVDAAVNDLLIDGTIDTIVNAYAPGIFSRPATTYVLPN